MYGISLEDLDLWINLTQKVGEDGYRYTAHAILSSFWGEYDFDQNGEIRVLSQGDDRVLRVASEDKSRIERKFRMLIRDAEAYELSGSELKLYSDQEYMNFYATD